jgi:hypothetical protein
MWLGSVKHVNDLQMNHHFAGSSGLYILFVADSFPLLFFPLYHHVTVPLFLYIFEFLILIADTS